MTLDLVTLDLAVRRGRAGGDWQKTIGKRLSAKLVNELPTRIAGATDGFIETSELPGGLLVQNILNHDFVQRRSKGFRDIF
jgi:hypothetical protein